MPPTEKDTGMLCLSRHENCPWEQALKGVDWTGLQYSCLRVLHLYCKVFEQEDVIEMVIRKTCKTCGCDRLSHAVYHEELGSVRERLGLRESHTQTHHAYDSPPGLTAKQTELYWSSLAERAPNIGGVTGAAAWRAWRTRALASQIPKQDLSLSHCRHIDEVHKKEYEDFIAARNEIALDIGIASQQFNSLLECFGCSKPIRSGSIAVLAPRLCDNAYYHPGCFTCHDCDELLVDLAYCPLDGQLYCVRHYADRLKPRCHACDELLADYIDLVLRNVNINGEMGLFLSVVISYAGVNDAMECIRHILSGMVPDTEPDFQDLVEYYTTLLHKSTSLSSQPDWITECGQGYLCLTEDENGKLKSCAIKYYDGQPNSTAILFSTKISSFGQESVEDINTANGDIKTERYIQTKTKTIIPQTTESINIGQSIRNRSPTPENISDPSRFSEGSFGRDNSDVEDTSEAKEKLTWHYRPLSPTPQSPLPEIHFQSYDGNTKESAYSEEYLRSLDGIKFRPLQRSDPSGRRRSFKKRNSSSSNSSRDSRASRDEELKIFTSLEEAEFDRVNNEQTGGFGSTPNLSAHSHSRSRSRENSKEGRNESWSVQASVDSNPDDNLDSSLKPKLKDLPKLGSFEEEKEEKKETDEVNEDLEEEIEDFWGNSDD